MEFNSKHCPFCGSILDEKSILYKGYYVCSRCAQTINESLNAEIIRQYSTYIRNLEFKRADILRTTKLLDLSMDVNELQLFTFYSAILDLFLTRDPSKIIKFLLDSTATDYRVFIEVLNYLSSISNYVEKLGRHILEYVEMQAKYLSHVNDKELERAVIEVKKSYFPSIPNKSAFIKACFSSQKMNLNEIIHLIETKSPSTIAALYIIFDDVVESDYKKEEIEHYLLACDYALELYYEKTKRKLSNNYRDYYKKSNELRKKHQIKLKETYKWQKKVRNNWISIFY